MAAVVADPDAYAIPWRALSRSATARSKPLARGVLAPRVLVPAPRPPDPVLPERRRLVDRRRDRTGQLVGLGAGVDGAGFEGVGAVHARMIAPATCHSR